MAFTQDITERRRSQERLQESEERFRSLIASLNDVVYTLDDQQRHTALYGKWVADMGIDPNYFLGRSSREIVGAEAAVVHEAANARALAGESVLYDWSTMLDGKERHYQTMVSPLRNSAGQAVGVVGVGRDVTGQKETEWELRQSHAELAAALQNLQDAQAQLIQQERLAAVGQLAAGIAHDFNNILAVILLYAQMMNRSSQLPPWETEAVVTIEQQTKTAAQLVQQILDFSRRSMMEKRTLDWLPLLKEQVRLLRHTLPDNITVSLQAAPTGGYMVRADAARLQQMVLNLAVNARDAMPDGGELRLELDKLDLTAAQDSLPAGSWLRLRVSDTGQGITEEDSQHIFEPFFTTKPPGQGSGLGLSQAQGIVLQHDGRIELTTAVGQGTTFTIYLPAVAEEPELVAAPATTESGRREACAAGGGQRHCAPGVGRQFAGVKL
jgi:PAS domain S-box-containing protein